MTDTDLTLTGEPVGGMLVASRGEARHEVLQVITEAVEHGGAVTMGRWQVAREILLRDGRDADAWQFCSAEQIGDRRWLVTHVAFWLSESAT